MGRKQREKLLQFIDDLVANSVAVLTTQLGASEPAAREAATEIAHRLCSQYGRTYMYIPTDLDFQLTARDQEIWDDYGRDGPGTRKYTRDRVDQIATERSLTPQQIYSIIRLVHKREVASRQGQLPGLDPA